MLHAAAAVVQSTQYYPFGTSFADAQPYKYNGKELDKRNGLNMYDYSARYYEAATGRFTTVDPMAEKYYNSSPYVYTFNNPLRYVDPLGTDIVHVNPDGTPQRYPGGRRCFNSRPTINGSNI